MEFTPRPEVQRFVDDQVRRGRYASSEDLVNAALVAFMTSVELSSLTSEDFDALWPGWREKIAEGVASADAGELTDGEEFFEQLEREERELAAKDDARKSA